MSLWTWIMAGFRGYRPRPELPTADRQALERIARKLDRIERRQDETERRQTEILDAQSWAKEQTMALTEQVKHLVEEVNQSRGLTASMATFVRGVPALVRQAVQEALAANPGLSAEDLEALTQAADDLDASQAEILSAMQSNAVPGENTGTPPARTEMGGTVEASRPQEGGSGGVSEPGVPGSDVEPEPGSGGVSRPVELGGEGDVPRGDGSL